MAVRQKRSVLQQRGRRSTGFLLQECNCGREFEGRRLRELTVHHKDHDHNNNPPDGSNWELLCLYCHDHDKYMTARQYGGGTRSAETASPGVFQPFAGLDELLEPDSGDTPVAETPDDPEDGA